MTINDVGKRTGSSNYGRIRSRAAHLEADEEKGKRLGGRAVRSKGNLVKTDSLVRWSREN